MEKSIAHEANPRVWSSLAEGGVKVVHAQFEVRSTDLKEGVLKQMVLSGLQDLKKEIEGSNEFKGLRGIKIVIMGAEPITGGFLAKFQVHANE